MKKFKKIFQSFRERSQQINKKNIPIATISILAISLFFLAGCSGTLKTTKLETGNNTGSNNNSPNYSYPSYMTRSIIAVLMVEFF